MIGQLIAHPALSPFTADRKQLIERTGIVQLEVAAKPAGCEVPIYFIDVDILLTYLFIIYLLTYSFRYQYQYQPQFSAFIHTP